MRRLTWIALLAFACDGESISDAGAERDARIAERDASIPAPPPATGIFPDHSRTLPFDYVRDDVGDPIDAAERTRITDLYLDVLERTDWLDRIEERAHGWP